MITFRLQIVLLSAVCVYFIMVFQLLKRKALNLKYALLWIASGFLMSILAIFPQILHFFASLIGVSDPMNALFSVVLFCVIIILMSLTSIASKLNQKNKNLIQSVAIMEKRIRDLEKDNTNDG